jgi:uncharacterized damage-inducible protein DinB
MSDPASLHLHAMACNNAWSNHRLLKACAQLSPDDFAAARKSFFPSIQATLNHILIVDWYYVDALEGGSLGPAAWKSEIPCPGFADLDREQRKVDRRLIDFCRKLTPDRLGSPVSLIREKRVQKDRTDRVLLHLFQHQIHHRGQAHAMLSGTKVKPPQLDEFFMTDEAPLRARELTELGLDEDRIWSGLRR